MGLSRALYTGISGLERQQVNLDVIGNNIANVNTNGYKSQRVLFNDIMYQTLKSSTAKNDTNAGTNPSQIGAGVDISVVDTNFNQGEIETTGIATDLSIEGNGFFIMNKDGQQLYSRDGAFSLSQDRRLISGATGMSVQGWNLSRDNAGNASVNSGGAISDVVIPIGDERTARATSEVIFNGNLNNDGDVGTTGTIMSSQRLFSSTSDVEVTTGAIDLSDVYIKDPAGGVDNVRLFSGSGSDSSGATGILATGDQVTVQLMKGGRPLEAIFVYGDGDTVHNSTGVLGPDGNPDAGKESYDGKTLDEFLRWFDEAFGLHAVEDKGSGAVPNAAHAVDGDNPNDLVDMGGGVLGTTPFTDETDGEGFEFVMSSSGGTNGDVPKVAYIGGAKEFEVRAGSSADVGLGNSYIDIDGDGAYDESSDIILADAIGYVANTEGSVTQGNGGSPVLVRAFHDGANSNVVTPNNVAYIDVSGNKFYDPDNGDIVISEMDGLTLMQTDILTNLGPAANLTTGTTTISVSNRAEFVADAAEVANLDVGAFTIINNQEYYIVSKSVTGTGASAVATITLDRSLAGGVTDDGTGGALELTTATWQTVQLKTALGYTLAGSSVVGQTIATSLTIPKGRQVEGKYQGIALNNVMTDNEAGMAGSMFVEGDGKIKVTSATGSGEKFAYVDSDGDGELNEKVFRVISDGATLYVDLDGVDASDTPGTPAAYDAGNDGQILKSPTITDLSNYSDNDVVYINESTGDVYRKVPKMYNDSETAVYLDKHNKGTYDEQRFEIVSLDGSSTDANADPNLWVVDENSNGVWDAGENMVISTEDGATKASVLDNDSVDLNRADAHTINGLTSGSGRVQIRGNIGVENAIANVSFISGANAIERNIFASSALADAAGHGHAIVSEAVGESVNQNIVVFDSLGKSHDIAMTFVLEKKDNDTATWRWFAESGDVAQSGGIFPAGDPRGNQPAVNVGSGMVEFDNFGTFLRASGPTKDSEAMIHIPLEGNNTDSALSIKPDFSIITGFASSTGSEVNVREQDGFAQGVLDRFSVNADGTVTGIYTNGMTEVVAQVALAAFANPDGLNRVGGNLFSVGANSGNAMIGAAQTAERGAIRGGALETSNVELTEEFTKMIVAQRSYQANSRVITKADALLEELIQIVR